MSKINKMVPHPYGSEKTELKKYEKHLKASREKRHLTYKVTIISREAVTSKVTM